MNFFLENSFLIEEAIEQQVCIGSYKTSITCFTHLFFEKWRKKHCIINLFWFRHLFVHF